MVALDVIPPPAAPGHAEDRQTIFQPLRFKSGLEVKNRLFRSSISGQFDDYSGHGTNARLNWEEQFARGGIGAIISSFVPVSIRGRILVRYATIDADDKIGFWRKVAERVHDPKYADPKTGLPCRFILQLSHSGRQQDIGGVENLYKRHSVRPTRRTTSTASWRERMTRADIRDVVQQFAEARDARRKPDSTASSCTARTATY